MPHVIEPLRRDHQREGFDCGEAGLNEYLLRCLRQDEERGLGRGYVAVPAGEKRVVGFYTLAAGAVAFAGLPDALRRRLPRYPIPVAHLGRLATCRSVRGQGVGEALLIDALRRSLRVAAELGIVAMEVRARSDRARGFYEKYGVAALRDDPHHLYLPLATARRALEP